MVVAVAVVLVSIVVVVIVVVLFIQSFIQSLNKGAQTKLEETLPTTTMVFLIIFEKTKFC